MNLPNPHTIFRGRFTRVREITTDHAASIVVEPAQIAKILRLSHKFTLHWS